MRSWKVIVTAALILGLTTAPLAVQVHAEESGESNPPSSGDHTHAHKGTKKETQAKSETKKVNSAAEEGSSKQPSDSHGVHGSSFDDIEGSH